MSVENPESVLGRCYYVQNYKMAQDAIDLLHGTTKEERLKELFAKLYVAHHEGRNKDVHLCLFAIDYLLNEDFE